MVSLLFNIISCNAIQLYFCIIGDMTPEFHKLYMCTYKSHKKYEQKTECSKTVVIFFSLGRHFGRVHCCSSFDLHCKWRKYFIDRKKRMCQFFESYYLSNKIRSVPNFRSQYLMINRNPLSDKNKSIFYVGIFY